MFQRQVFASNSIYGKLYEKSVYETETGLTGPWWDPRGAGLCVWSAYAPKGAASFAASLVDLSGNGNNAGDPGGANTPSWSAANGWEFNAANNEYLTTTFVPANDQSQSMLVQFSNATTGLFSCLAGQYDTATISFTLVHDNNAGGRRYSNGKAVNVAGGVFTNGNMAVAGNQGYYNGIADGGLIDPYNPHTRAVYIGVRNPITGYYTGYIQAVVIYDCTLTAGQVLSIATAMAAL